MNIKETLTQALTGRIDEVALYQINIDNYRLAIEHIDGMSTEDQNELAAFRHELEQRLSAELHQQKRAKVMLAVIQKQVEAL
jgi:hypothetical protein